MNSKDVFHAKARIVKEMSPQHPDFKAAKHELTELFAKIQNINNSMKDPTQLSEAFQQWLKSYSTTLNNTDNIYNQVHQLGNFQFI